MKAPKPFATEADPLVWCRAKELWRAREMQLPARVRRMQPDRMDMISGAWQRVVEFAARAIAEPDRAIDVVNMRFADEADADKWMPKVAA